MAFIWTRRYIPISSRGYGRHSPGSGESAPRPCREHPFCFFSAFLEKRVADPELPSWPVLCKIGNPIGCPGCCILRSTVPFKKDKGLRRMEPAEHCGWGSLPHEMAHIILLEATRTKHQRDDSFITNIVCKFVCRQWHDLLYLPRPRTSPLRKPHSPYDFAAGSGLVELLKWAREHGCPWDERACVAAAKRGHMAVLKWAGEHGCPWDPQTCTEVAYKGNLGILKWLRETGCPWDAGTCSHAAWGGNLEVLEWARANGWDQDTCSLVAINHLEVLKWARANGCPWDAKTSYSAASGGDLEILK